MSFAIHSISKSKFSTPRRRSHAARASNCSASPDGFDLTQDLTTGLEWLDVPVSAGRTFDDIVGNDGTSEFAPGGDFEGFRHAAFLELTGWINGPQLDSPFAYFGFTSEFASIGGHGPVRNFMSYLGCLANCQDYGYVSGPTRSTRRLPVFRDGRS